MNDQPKETLALGPKPERQKRVAGRKTRKYKRGSRQATWDYVPPELIPPGMVVEWKRISTLGEPEPSENLIMLEEQGWEPATKDSFGPMLPLGSEKNTIERRGQRLYMRPKELSDEARAEEKAAADEQLRGKLQQLGMAGQGEFARKSPVVKRTYERIEVPEE